MAAAVTNLFERYRHYIIHFDFNKSESAWCARIPGLGEAICEPTFDLAFAKARGYIDCLSRKTHPIIEVARENPISARAAWTVGLLTAVGLVVGGIVLVTHKAEASTPVVQPMRAPPKYITGHRYRVRITGAPVAKIDPYFITAANAQAKIDQQSPGLVKVVSAILIGTTTISVTVDYLAQTQDSKLVTKELADQLAARGLTSSNVTVTIADEGVPSGGAGTVDSGATDVDAWWHAWKQTYEGDDNAVDVYVGMSENAAATAAAYYATLGFRTGYYSVMP